MSRSGRPYAAPARGAALPSERELRHKGTGCIRIPMAIYVLIAPHVHAPHTPLSYPFAQGVRGLQPAVIEQGCTPHMHSLGHEM